MAKYQVILTIATFFLTACSTQECTGEIEALVLYEKRDVFGSSVIYVDIKNRSGIGKRKTLYNNGKLYGTLNNVAIIYDFRNRYKGQKWICFSKQYFTRTATCGAELNPEHIPELQIYY